MPVSREAAMSATSLCTLGTSLVLHIVVSGYRSIWRDTVVYLGQNKLGSPHLNPHIGEYRMSRLFLSFLCSFALALQVLVVAGCGVSKTTTASGGGSSPGSGGGSGYGVASGSGGESSAGDGLGSGGSSGYGG